MINYKIIGYIKMNPFISIICIYFLFSTILKSTSGIDICIPCIWKTFLGFNCPGCGLTKAFISLIELDVKKAFENNWLIFIIMPLGSYYLIHDYYKYTRKILRITAPTQKARFRVSKIVLWLIKH